MTKTLQTPPHVGRVTAQETHPLRHAILRPHQRPGPVPFEGDEDPLAAHFAVRCPAGRPIAVATVLPEKVRSAPTPRAAEDPSAAGSTSDAQELLVAPPIPGDWRLRGMATDPSARRGGLGAALVRACAEHAAAHGGTALWCHARVGARAFYRSQGFLEVGTPFDVPEIGAHILMWRPL